MYKLKTVPWEMLGAFAVIILLILSAYGLGRLAFCTYRHFRPLKQDDFQQFQLVDDEAKDGFFTTFLVGLVLLIFIGFTVYFALFKLV